MDFGRDDYNEVLGYHYVLHNQKIIPEDEPVFLFRAQDPLAYEAIDAYRKLLKEKGLFEMEKSVKRQLTAMKKWRQTHAKELKGKLPDLPEEN